MNTFRHRPEDMHWTFFHFLFTYLFFFAVYRPRLGGPSRAESGCETGKVLSIKLNRIETPPRRIYMHINIYMSAPIMETSIAVATVAQALQAPAHQTRGLSGTNIIFRFVEQLFEIGEMSIIYFLCVYIILRSSIKMTGYIYEFSCFIIPVKNRYI